ncbi:3D domain-containing protein [Myxococcota bacterium]
MAASGDFSGIRTEGSQRRVACAAGCRLGLAGLGVALTTACATAGSTWMAQPEPIADDDWDELLPTPAPATSTRPLPVGPPVSDPGLGAVPPRAGDAGAPPPDRSQWRALGRPRLQGRRLGTFSNTYYDFPSERDYAGPEVDLKDTQCRTISRVPRTFFESVCVQGSGALQDGGTVSFARRDCKCAELCPRTQQRICFDLLARAQFPWGRGAAGKPIVPLLTVAVDTSLVPFDTYVYVPEYDGLPRDAARTSFHDGCFVVQDRGLLIQGKRIDVFTGHESVTRLWNRLVPSHQGVTVWVDSPRCARASPL